MHYLKLRKKFLKRDLKMRKYLLFIIVASLISHKGIGANFSEIRAAYLQSYNYEKTGNYKDAIRVLLSIYNLSHDPYLINLRLGWLYYLDGRYANSIDFYKKASKAAPEAIEPLLGISLPLLAQGRFSEVETLMYEVLKKDFYNYFGNLRLIVALRNQKKFDQAKKIAEKMLKLYPTDINFLLELGLIEKGKGNISKAKKIFKRILYIDPLNRIAKNMLQFW